MADLKMMLQNLRDKSKCCKKDDFTGERYTIIHDMSIETLNMICEDGIEQLENAKTVNRWIPCSERLPDNGVAVLVYTGENNFKVWLAEYSKYMEVWTLAGNYVPIKKNAVSHWMPLPERPESEVQSEK